VAIPRVSRPVSRMSDRFRAGRSILRMTAPGLLLGDSLFALLQSGDGRVPSEPPGPLKTDRSDLLLSPVDRDPGRHERLVSVTSVIATL
jgi:hypothetical protein